MPTSSRALVSSCLLASLVACTDPPSPTQEAKPEPTEPAKPAEPAPPEEGFTGTPVATQTLPSGLVIEDFVIGQGAEAVTGGEVSVHYRGTLDDGTIFDTSRKRNRPYMFTLGEGRVIKGWDQGVPGMKVGGKRRLTVPAELAYGQRKKGKIPPDSRLTFTIELVDAMAPLPAPRGDEVYAGEPLTRTELDRGLVIEEFAAGEGRAAANGDKVYVHYTGKLDDGTVFDGSMVSRKKPISFVLGKRNVIEGWDLGLVGMKIGGLRRLIIPAELAYGARGKGKIPPNSRLTFTVEMMAIRDAPPSGKVPAQPSTVSPSLPANPNPTPTPNPG